MENKESKPKRAVAKKPLARQKAKEEHAFLMCTGTALHSIKQLADELENVDEAVYYYHTANGRNDFAQWAQDIFGNAELADKMRSAHSKDQLRTAVYRFLLEHK